jgi:hypothetical protein
MWIKADRMHPLIPYKSKRWNSAYRKRVAVEREFGRLKNEWGLKPLRVRGLERVRLHADLTILTRLACALSRARAGADMDVRLSSPQPPKARERGPSSWPRRRRSTWCATRGQADMRGLATAGPGFVSAPAV